MSKASGRTGGDKRRSERLGRLRAAVPYHNAIEMVKAATMDVAGRPSDVHVR